MQHCCKVFGLADNYLVIDSFLRDGLLYFFSSNSMSVLVFQVRDVRMISDRNSRRSKGIAYVEFVDVSSVPLAIGLTGQRVLGVPIIVQASQVRKCKPQFYSC